METIGHDARVLEPEPFPGATEAGLYLVEHHQQPALVAQRSHIAQVLVIRGNDPTFTLNGLE